MMCLLLLNHHDIAIHAFNGTHLRCRSTDVALQAWHSMCWRTVHGSDHILPTAGTKNDLLHFSNLHIWVLRKVGISSCSTPVHGSTPLLDESVLAYMCQLPDHENIVPFSVDSSTLPLSCSMSWWSDFFQLWATHIYSWMEVTRPLDYRVSRRFKKIPIKVKES